MTQDEMIEDAGMKEEEMKCLQEVEEGMNLDVMKGDPVEESHRPEFLIDEEKEVMTGEEIIVTIECQVGSESSTLDRTLNANDRNITKSPQIKLTLRLFPCGCKLNETNQKSKLYDSGRKQSQHMSCLLEVLITV